MSEIRVVNGPTEDEMRKLEVGSVVRFTTEYGREVEVVVSDVALLNGEYAIGGAIEIDLPLRHPVISSVHSGTVVYRPQSKSGIISLELVDE